MKLQDLHPRALLNRLDAWWFTPAPASRLGLLRIGLALYLLVETLDARRSFLRVAAADPSRYEPVGVMTWLGGPMDPGLYQLLLDGCIVGMVLMLFGVGWRVVGPALAIGWLVCATYRLSWGQIYRSYHLPALHLLVLGLAPATAGLSIDAWIQRRFPEGIFAKLGSGPSQSESGAYGWPIRLMCTLGVITYVLAGVAKVQGASGWAWGNGQNLLDQVGYDAIHKELLSTGPVSPWVEWVYQHPEVMTPMATGSLILELAAPIALLHPLIGQLWAVAVMGMHWGIAGLMTITFPYPVSGAAYLGFFRVERLLPQRWR